MLRYGVGFQSNWPLPLAVLDVSFPSPAIIPRPRLAYISARSWSTFRHPTLGPPLRPSLDPPLSSWLDPVKHLTTRLPRTLSFGLPPSSPRTEKTIKSFGRVWLALTIASPSSPTTLQSPAARALRVRRVSVHA